MNRYSIALFAALAAFTALAGLVHANGSAPRAALSPIVIAVEAPITGSQASTGRDIVRGVRLAVREVNARGGVLGRQIRLIKADDRGERSLAKRVARQVISRDAVAVIGPYNSSVGIVNLPIYLRNGVAPMHLTSTDETRAQGVTVQPKNSQIAPVEKRYVAGTGADRVAMLVDDTANGAFTVGMANRLSRRLARDDIDVTRVSVKETGDVSGDYYATKVAEALSTQPDLVYVSTYYAEGVEIAKALAASGSEVPCLMGLANVDPAFVASAGLDVSRRCRFSGIPAAGQLPSARAFVRRYRRTFEAEPGVWGVFAHDSAKLLFAKMRSTGTTAFRPLLGALRRTKGYRAATGTITIDRRTGYRRNLPVSILRVNGRRQFVIAR
jgi:branched-chain amino acid transport system substrate-binding protein